MQTSCSPREHLSSSHYLHDTALIWLENLAFIKYDLLFGAKDGFSVKSELRRHQFWAVLKSTAHSFLHNCLSDQPTISQRWHRNRCKPFVRYTRAAKPYLRNTWIRAASGSSEVTLSPPHLWPEPWPCPANSRGRRRPRRLEAPLRDGERRGGRWPVPTELLGGTGRPHDCNKMAPTHGGRGTVGLPGRRLQKDREQGQGGAQT